MKIDRYVNKLLGKFWPEDEQGNRKVRFHSQNLNEGRNGMPDGLPIHGRLWLNVDRKAFEFEWSLGSTSCGIGVGTGGDSDHLLLHAALPPVSFYFGLPVYIKRIVPDKWLAKLNEKTGGHKGSHKYSHFHIADIRIFDSAIWWDFMKFDWGWSNQMPKWMHGGWHPLDTFFGRHEHTEEKLKKHDILIPMPEGNYKATVQFSLCTWKRQRLPWASKKGVFSYVDIPGGIPHEGKGENDYDCGEDATYGLSRESATVSDAIAEVVKSLLNSRRKYNGNALVKYPPPEERLKAIEEQRKKAEEERAKNPAVYEESAAVLTQTVQDTRSGKRVE